MIARLELQTRKRTEMIDITGEVQGEVARSGVRSGLCLVWVPHTTAGLTVNENADPSVRRDILAALDRLVPREGDYRHSEGNSDGHIKSTLCGRDVTLAVEEGALVLGTWQGLFFCEFDGPRRRSVIVKVFADR
ncbi:MAG: YjbQ family protein [Euryarchaeota archaeon]|nr:YjbQ family protein [Euryarchaeota archaeon]